MGARRTALVVLFGCLAGGCRLGPDYERPPVVAPERWRELSAAEAASMANTPWWELFEDRQLQEYIRIALAENKDLKIAVERIEEARALYGISRADLFPRVNASGSVGRARVSEKGPLAVPGADVEDNFISLGADLAWEIDIFGRVRRATEAQRAILLATEQAQRSVVIALVAAVAQAYIELRDFDRRLEIARDTVESRRAYVELARVRFQGGLTSELDWRQAEAELHRTQSFLYDFERLVGQKENELSLLLGRNPGALARGRSIDVQPVPPAIPAGLPSELLDRRPDLLEAEQLLVSQNARIGEAKALLYPRFSLTGFFGWESTDFDDLFTAPARTWSISGNVLQAIFNSGENLARVEAAESRQRQALYGYERAILQAFREVEDALIGYRKTGDQQGSQRDRVGAEKRVLRLAELRYRGGVAAYLEVLDAQRSLFDSELDEVSAVTDHFLWLIRLYKALGGGWPHEPEKKPAAAEPAPEGKP
jgi:multidrug efflux system outer membrane protein